MKINKAAANSENKCIKKKEASIDHIMINNTIKILKMMQINISSTVGVVLSHIVYVRHLKIHTHVQCVRDNTCGYVRTTHYIYLLHIFVLPVWE